MITADKAATPLDPRYGALASDEVIARTAVALRARGFEVHVVDDREQARALTLAMVPAGAEVNIGSTQTLDELGVKAEIEGSGRYDALRPKLWAMDRATQMRDIRKLASAPDFFLNSANAVTEDGSLVLASYSGSQIGPIALGAGRVILVIGAQKIVADVPAALLRLREYNVPAMEAMYGVPTAINKVLIFNGEFLPGRVTVILVKDVIGI